MYPKSTIQYQTNFTKIINVSFSHEFYNDKRLQGIEIIPDVETKRNLRNYSLLYKEQLNGFLLLMDRNVFLQSPVFSGSLELKFDFSINNIYFLNITDIPFQYNHFLVFKNEFPDKNILHKNFYVDEENIFESYKGGISGRIHLTINEDNEFFGGEENDKNKFPFLEYDIKFNSRKARTRFNIFTNQEDVDLSQYYIFDEVNSKILDDFTPRTLENGMNVLSLFTDKSYNLKDTYNFKYFLKKNDTFNKEFSKTIPHPNIKSISFERRINEFINDIFIVVD